MGTLAMIGLGSNLGDRKAILDAAVKSLAETPGVELRAASTYHETSPVGGPPGQGPFLNAAALVDSSIEPMALLESIRQIETKAGRRRDEHWAARTLDLDILLFGDLIVGRPPRFLHVGVPGRPLSLPHPWLPFRRFALAPASEIAPEMIDPVTGRTLSQLLANLDRRPSYLALAGHPGPRMRRIFRRLADELGAIGVSGGEPSWQEEIQRWYANVPGITSTPNEDLVQRARRIREEATRNLGHFLRRDRWSSSLWGDRWMITDFWLDQWWWVNGRPLGENDETRSQAIEPTFVALIPPWHKDFKVHDTPRLTENPEVHALGVALPPFMTCGTLEMLQSSRAADPAASDEPIIAAILDACRATRS